MEYNAIINRDQLSLYLIGDFSNVSYVGNVKIRDAENNIVFNLSNDSDGSGFHSYKIDPQRNTNELKISCDVVNKIDEDFILTFDINLRNRKKINKRYIYKNNSFATLEK